MTDKSQSGSSNVVEVRIGGIRVPSSDPEKTNLETNLEHAIADLVDKKAETVGQVEVDAGIKSISADTEAV